MGRWCPLVRATARRARGPVRTMAKRALGPAVTVAGRTHGAVAGQRASTAVGACMATEHQREKVDL
jgi:hypothetical protein